MAQHQDSTHNVPDEEQRPALTSFSSGSSAAANSIEEAEFKERHGDQYHLRHHLSGCAQTLYTLDFENDFSTPDQNENIGAHLLTAESALPTSVTGVEITLINTTTSVLSAAESLPQMVSPSTPVTHQVTEQAPTALTGSAKTAAKDLSSIEEADPTLTYSGLRDEAQLIDPISETHPQTPPGYITNFDDNTLGGWNLNPEANVDNVLQNNQLHFDQHNWQNGETLLTRQFILPEGQHYAFEMQIRTEGNAAPPAFALHVDGLAYDMEWIKAGDNYHVRAEFYVNTSQPFSLSIVPLSPLIAGQSVWMDNLVVQPAAPVCEFTAETHGVLPEPVFEFDRLESAVAKPAMDETRLKLSLMLVQEDLALYPASVDPDRSSVNDLELDKMVGRTPVEQWNSQADTTHTEGSTVTVDPSFMLPPDIPADPFLIG
ncbi:hypothetical protein SOM41_13155 [Enterobacter sp. CFBP8995]|nr:hypothetical protein [Enterobacter sp. CFBP8995]